MNKRAFFGFVLIIVVAVVFVIGSAAYFMIKNYGVTVQSGEVTIQINPNNQTDSETIDEQIVEIPLQELNETIFAETNTSSNLTENNNSLIEENISQ